MILMLCLVDIFFHKLSDFQFYVIYTLVGLFYLDILSLEKKNIVILAQ